MAVQIKKRKTTTGSNRWIVYYRRGGRAFKTVYAGSFATKREAETRRDLIAGELAAGRDPKTLLDSLRTRPTTRPGLAHAWDGFMRSRIDVGTAAQSLYGNARDRWLPILGANTDPHAVTVEQIQHAIVEDLAMLAPATITHYTSTLRQVLDFADVTPNPCTSRKLRLPAAGREEIDPPTTAEWHKIVQKVPSRSLLALELIECLGLRVSECTLLEFGDLDFGGGRMRVARARTKTRSGRRWLAVPDELLARLAETCPEADRAGRPRVFVGLSNDMLRHDFLAACRAAGVRALSPHDLRHRRISLWIRLGVDGTTAAVWAGHARASMTWDTYSHVVVDGGGDRWAGFWLSVYARTRSRDDMEVEA